jgi:hypothetical protein
MMRALQNTIVLALIGYGAYTAWNWQFGAAGGDESERFAEQSCIDSVRNRFDTSGVRVNSVRANEKGYVVRASMTLARGGIAKVTCLTNENGTVEDVFVEER